MAKENETIKNKETGSVNLGSVKIADDVVASIAAIAACEVDGVKSIDGTASENLFSKVGIRGVTRGAKVEVNGKQVRAAVAIIMDYGYNIPETCQYVQKRVKNSIENMTGLEVVDVNIRIAGINVEG
jgi:uncharacterized alkaline shock family protein YloU